MGFKAAGIVAPNVPDKVDPIKYLTTPPQTRSQEQAQAQAYALGYAKLRGMTPIEIESIITGAEASKRANFQPVSSEEQCKLQDAKTSKIPTKITRAANVPHTTIDYPYLFTHTRIRYLFQNMDTKLLPKDLPTTSASSIIGKTECPVFTLTQSEYEMGPLFLDNIKSKISEYGIVKIKLPENKGLNSLPFASDSTGFGTIKQTFTNPASSFDYRQIKRGFFRALIRFHSTVDPRRKIQKLPSIDGKPIDFFRLFHLCEIHGGADAVIAMKEWAQVGRELGYSTNAIPTLSTTMRVTYTKYLQPFKEWFVGQIPKAMNPHVIPRFDVDDTGNSTWHKLSHGIVVDINFHDTEFTTRHLHEYMDMNYANPCYTLRMFKQCHDHPDSISAEQAEERYLHLPEYYQAERMYPPTKLHSNPENLSKTWDPWDMSSLSTRFNYDFFEYITDVDMDEVLLAELDVGSKFATYPWHKPRAGAYEIHMVVEGHPRMWYTRQGVWAQQQSSEIMVVDPNCEVMEWNLNYSLGARSFVLLNSNWLSNIVQIDADVSVNSEILVCVQQIVYNIAQSCAQGHRISANVQSQALNALEFLADKERYLLRLLNPTNRIVKTTIQPPITCSIIGRKRFFSWIIVDGKVYSLDAYARKLVPQKPFQLVTQYDDFETFSNGMRVRILNATIYDADEWSEQLDAVANKPDYFPTVSQLNNLVTTAPETHRHQASRLVNAIDTVRKFNESNGSEIDLINLIECSDDDMRINHLLDKYRHAKAEALERCNMFFNHITNDSEEPIDPVALMQATETLLNESRQYISEKQLEALKDAKKLVHWTRKLYSWGFLKPSGESAATIKSVLDNLKETAAILKIPTWLPVMHILSNAIKGVNTAENELRMLLRSSSKFKTKEYERFYNTYLNKPLEYAPIANNALLSEFYEKLELLKLADKMGHNSFLDRPRRSEAMVHSSFVPFAIAISQLDTWLSAANHLDWPLIAGNMQKMMKREPFSPDRTISIGAIVKSYADLHHLKVVPDDVEGVQKTFETAVNLLTQTPLAILSQYGFVP